jgi:vacuolar protein sorting-associated protein 53
MLLDSYVLKAGLTSLLPAPAPTGFVKRVNASFSRIEALLKTMQVRPSPPEALVQAYLIHIADRNDANFRKVLELKGIKIKQEQNQLVDLLQIHRASERHAPHLQQSNPLFATLQAAQSSTSGTPGSVSQSLTSAAATISSSNLPARFDPSMFGSAIISAAKDGVDRFGNQTLNTLGSSTTASGAGGSATGGTPPSLAAEQGLRTTNEGSATTNLNENLKNIGKFFRRDLGGFGGRFSRGGEDGSK